jgi:lathosterol oxidase
VTRQTGQRDGMWIASDRRRLDQLTQLLSLVDVDIILLEFVGLFAFILLFGYLLPAGQFYFRYQVRKDPAMEPFRIQERRPSPGQVRREVKSSLVTIFIFAVMSTILLELYKAGKTSIYTIFHDYPWYWIPLSFVLSLVIHDTYFYWLHRFMHWPPVFKYLHLSNITAR